MSETSNILAELHVLACACESGHSIDEWRNDFHHGIKGAMSELARLRKVIRAIADNKIDIELMHGDKPFYAIRWNGHCHCSYNGFENALEDLVNALKEVKSETP